MRTKLIVLMALLAFPAYALVLDTPLTDAAQERTAQRLFHDMKCVVCEGQSLAESDAQFAQQMRAHIRRMLADGATEHEVRTYFVTRYGERILLTPPVNRHTYLLWAAPLLLVFGGGLILWRNTRHSVGDDA